MSELIINLDDALLRDSQAYARQQGQELDALVAELLRAAVRAPAQAEPTQPTRPLSPRIQRLFGSVKVSADVDYRTELTNALSERYGA